MKKSYLFSFALSTLLFASNTSLNIITPNPIETNSSIKQATSEAIILLKDKDKSNLIIDLFKNINGFTHQEFNLTSSMHIKVPGKSFDQIKSMINSIPMAGDSIKQIDPNYAYKPYEATNDSYYSKLWAIENSGQSVNGINGTNDADMDVKEAWDIQKGSSDVVVAVVDTGVDYTHNDLADNMWNGNAKHGYDFAGDDDGNNDDNPMPDTPYDDNGHYHGTHVAGIIGAIGDNSNGVSGIAQNVKIMALKVFRPNGTGYTSDILEAMDYIAQQKDNGVNIVAVNASYGGGGSQGDSMNEAIKKLANKGIIFCAAAGNDGKDIDNDPVYPASYDAQNIITVGASDQDDKLASFSNYGKNTVEVVAPGTNILSTYPDNKYAYMQGTSMATPNVSGVVALLASENPTSTLEERIKAIINNVDKKDEFSNKTSTGGRVNAYLALKSIENSKNNAPIANDDSATTEYETKVIIDILSNDSDSDGDTLSIKSTTTPNYGSVIIKDNKLEYTPNSGFSGNDSINYIVTDNNGAEASANVSIIVKDKENSAPVANDDSATTEEDKKVIIDVLSNDSDSDGDLLTIEILNKPLYGEVEVKNGKVEYTPNINYNGNDNFEYRVNDSSKSSNKAKVDIYVKSINDAPIAQDDNITINKNITTIIDILNNDSDIDGDSLTIKIEKNPSHGKIEIKNNKIEYTPENEYVGSDSFAYFAYDGKEYSSIANVNIKINNNSLDDNNQNNDEGNEDNSEDNNSSNTPQLPIIDKNIKEIDNLFKNLKGAQKISENEYIFDNGKGDIKIDKKKSQIEISHLLAPMPKEPIKNINSFELKDNKLKVIFKLNKNLKF